jgi:hypothetical protein
VQASAQISTPSFVCFATATTGFSVASTEASWPEVYLSGLDVLHATLHPARISAIRRRISGEASGFPQHCPGLDRHEREMAACTVISDLMYGGAACPQVTGQASQVSSFSWRERESL